MTIQIGQLFRSSFHQGALYPGARKDAPQTGGPDKVKELQLRQQQLQNTMLLMKAAGSDGSGMPEETRKVLEQAMEQASLDLQAAKAQEARLEGPENTQRSSLDRYEKGSSPAAAPGVYRIDGGRDGYEISFMPYEDEDEQPKGAV